MPTKNPKLLVTMTPEDLLELALFQGRKGLKSKSAAIRKLIREEAGREGSRVP